jgi:hypothetical protein
MTSGTSVWTSARLSFVASKARLRSDAFRLETTIQWSR